MGRVRQVIALLMLHKAAWQDFNCCDESKQSCTLPFMLLNRGRPWPSFRLQKVALSRAGRVPYMKEYDMATKNMAAQNQLERHNCHITDLCMC